jgi:competence protein ComEA
MLKVPLRYVMAWLSRHGLVLMVACTCFLATFAPARGRAEPSQPARTNALADSERGVVNLNSASAEELVRLPGIGPTRAASILELRARLKRFTRVEELLRVKGIGRATFRKLRPLLTLEGPTTLRER